MADPVEPVAEVESPAPEVTLAAQYDAEATPDEASSTPAPVPASPPEEPEPPPAVSHPRYLIQLALDHGFSDEEIASYSSEQLGSAVYHLQKQARELARQTSQERETQRALERPRDGRPESSRPPESETGPAEEGLGIDETQYDPGIVSLFKKQQLELKLLKEKLGHLDNREQARANQTMTERVDQAFKKHEGALGKGARRDLSADSPEYARRMAILGMVDRDTSHRSLEEKIDRAVEVLYGQSPQPSPPSVPTPELTRQQRRWQEGAIARPTHRVADAEQPGVKKATKSVAEKLAQLSGGPTDNGEADESDFLG